MAGIADATPTKLKFTGTIADTFTHAESVAVDKTSGDLYVADTGNNRIEKLGPNGEFILTWGKEVNETKTKAVKEKGGTPTLKEIEEENVCTETEVQSGAKCKAGVANSEAGTMAHPQGVAVDPSSGNVYVQDPGVAEGNVQGHPRVDEFSPEGQFLLMFGGEVNKNGTDICAAAERAACQAGNAGSANGAFQVWRRGQGNMLSVGGPEHLVYVADEGRVQEFEGTGVYKTKIPLNETETTPAFPAKGEVTALAVDSGGDLYIDESYSSYPNEVEKAPIGIYEFAPGNLKAIKEIDNTDSHIEGMALDGSGHLAVTDRKLKGTLFDLTGSEPPSEFAPPSGISEELATGLSFGGNGKLYLADVGRQYIEIYELVVGAELQTKGSTCEEGTPVEALTMVTCTLKGAINPEGVGNTQAWFRWGATTELEHETPTRPFPPSTIAEPVEATVTGLAPNQPVYFELVASDENFQAPETLASQQASFLTPTEPPRVLGKPSASFVKPSSAVITGEVNPENAKTEYFVEYGIGKALARCPGGVKKEACAGVLSTAALESSRYKTVGATFEVTGLQPSTAYRARLSAINYKEEAAVTEAGGTRLPEEQFTTAPPVNPQAETGSVSNITATGAVISGQVNPDGELASYAFEIGVYAGANTQYGIVASGSAGEGTTPVGKTLQLSGLQPSTTYAYRVKIESVYGVVLGLPMTFTTEGLPSVLPQPGKPELLPVPSIALPNEPQPPGKKPLTRGQKLRKALQACKRKRVHARRLSCERSARKRYGPVPKKKHRKRK